MGNTRQSAISDTSTEATLILDSGGTSHAIGEAAAQALQADVAIRPVNTNIQLGEKGKVLQSKGRADVGSLVNTLVVPDGRLVDNIASVPQFDLDGRYILFGGQKARIGILDVTGSFKVHAEAVLGADRSYRFSGSDLMALPDVPETLRVAQARPPMSVDYIHDVFGHRSKRTCREAVVKGKLTGATPEQVVHKRGPMCGACAKAKATRHSFARARSSDPAKAKPPRLSPLIPLDPLHEEVVTDVKGPIGVDGPNGERWSETFTEVRSRWRTSKLFAVRSSAAGAIKEYFNLDCAREGLKIIRYHADGAPELISLDIVSFLAERGCRVTFSSPYTPEQNGLAEVSNRVIWEPALTMLMACVLPLTFWVYAVQYSTVLANCFPTWTHKGWMSPLECKYGIVPDISLFHKFGCLCYVHIPEQLRTGMAEKAYKGYFVGLEWPMWDRFLVFVPVLDKVVMSAHVLFDEIFSTERKDDHILIVDSERKVVGDFYFLRHMAYVEDDVLYVTTRVEKYRGYICAFRAPWVHGRLGKEEPRPTHAKDVELLLREYLLHNSPKRYDVVSKSLRDVCVVDSSALVDESRQWVAPTSMVAAETPHRVSVSEPDHSRASETLSSVATETPRTGATETLPPASTVVVSGVTSSDARIPSDSAVNADSVPSGKRKARRGRATRSVTLATDSTASDVASSISNSVGVSTDGGSGVSISSGGVVSSAVSAASASNSSLSMSDDYGSGINGGSNSFIGMSGFVTESMSTGRSRRRSAQRAPLNVGTFGNIEDTLRLLRDPPLMPLLEKLAYVSAEETFSVDLPDSHPLRWLDSKKKEVKSLVLEHDTWDVTALPTGRSAVDSRWVNTAKHIQYRRINRDILLVVSVSVVEWTIRRLMLRLRS